MLGALFVFSWAILGSSPLTNVSASVKTPPMTYLATQLDLHWSRYLVQFVWPFGIRMHPEVTVRGLTSWQSWMGLLLVAGSLTLAWSGRTRTPLVNAAVPQRFIQSPMLPERPDVEEGRDHLCLGAVRQAPHRVLAALRQSLA